MRKPCLSCNELTDQGSRCETCQAAVNRMSRRGQVTKTDNRSAAARGYDWQWDKLSARARKLQPFCSHCGSKEDLQADHKPVAWERKERGLTVRLQDIQVLCGRCNRAAGAARPGSARAAKAAANRRRRRAAAGRR